MSIPEQLRAAAQLIRDKGWWNADVGEGWCAANAIFFGIGRPNKIDDGQSLEAQDVFCRALELDATNSPASIWEWNDAPEQTAENVIAGLEYAALWYEQQQAQHVEPAAVLVPVTA